MLVEVCVYYIVLVVIVALVLALDLACAAASTLLLALNPAFVAVALIHNRALPVAPVPWLLSQHVRGR